jgi:translation initiation factor 3 subunit D
MAEAPSIARFVFPQIQDNPNGWGPCEVPVQFKDTPYQPFSKDDRLGKVADWTNNLYQDRRTANKYGTAYGSGQMYTYYHEQDESSFHLVDSSRPQRTIHHKPRGRQMQASQSSLYGMTLRVCLCSRRFVVTERKEKRESWEDDSKFRLRRTGRSQWWIM